MSGMGEHNKGRGKIVWGEGGVSISHRIPTLDPRKEDLKLDRCWNVVSQNVYFG